MCCFRSMIIFRIVAASKHSGCNTDQAEIAVDAGFKVEESSALISNITGREFHVDVQVVIIINNQWTQARRSLI